VDGINSQEERELRSQVEQVRGRLQGLADDLRVVDDEVDGRLREALLE